MVSFSTVVTVRNGKTQVRPRRDFTWVYFNHFLFKIYQTFGFLITLVFCVLIHPGIDVHREGIERGIFVAHTGAGVGHFPA